MFAKRYFALFLLFKSIQAKHRHRGGGRKKSGQHCFEDKSCDSNHCYKSKCVECETNSHCKSAPAIHCTKKKECSPWKRGKPLDSKGYPMNIDEGGLFWVPRKVIDTPVSYEVIRYPLDHEVNGGLTVTATHVYLPLGKHLQGEYAIDGPATGFKEAGIANLFAFVNTVSILSDNPLIAFVEKFHAIEVTGNSNTRSAERVEKEMASRTKLENKTAKTVRREGDTATTVHGSLSGVGNKLVELSKDIAHLNQIQDFVKEDGGKKGVQQLLTSEKFSSLKEAAKKTRILSHTKSSKKSMHNCRHYDTNSGIELTDTHAVIPLETNIFAGAGKVELSPSRWIQILFGHSVFKYNEEENTLEFIQVYTSVSHVNMDHKVDTEGLPKTALYVGPADGMNMAVSSMDGREDKYYDKGMSLEVKAALVSKNSYLLDYKRLYKDPQKVCTDKKRDSFQYSIKTAMQDWSNNELHETMWQATNLMRAIGRSVDCGINFLRTPLTHSNGFDTLEFILWAHFIMEGDMGNGGRNAVELALNSHFWDDGVILSTFDDYPVKTIEEVMYLREEKTD